MAHSVKRESVGGIEIVDLDSESYEQKLVRTTVEHPDYPLYYAFPSDQEGWVVTKLSKKHKSLGSTKMIAVDCERVLCEDGSEALAKVCVVDHNLQVKLNAFVKPMKKIVDYRTRITGITAADLDGTTFFLADAQKLMKKLLSKGTILVGHSLNYDLQALKILHTKIIDTALIFCKFGRRPSLNNLCKSILGYEVRKEGDPHDCVEDAQAAMKLVLAKAEIDVNSYASLHSNIMPYFGSSKLLLRKVPISVLTKRLGRLIPGNFRVECKSMRKGWRERYSALAVFKSPRDAHRAFKRISNEDAKEKRGRLRKVVSIARRDGQQERFFVYELSREDCEKWEKRHCRREEYECTAR